MALRFTFEKALGLLIFLTLVAVVAERPILKTTIELDPRSSVVERYDDSQEDGNSQSEILGPESTDWRCRLGSQKNYPYCGFELILNTRTQGLDLRNFDRIKLWLDYDGPTPSIRLYLRNYDQAYSQPGQNDSTKYNQIAFDADLARGNGPIEFSMDDFFVANWWFQRFGLRPELAHPQFDNIVVLEIQTGTDHQLGEHRFRLNRVELTGQILPRETWYQGIMATWLALAIGFLGSRLVSMKKELKRKVEREEELLEINALLDSRGRQLEEQIKTDPLTGAFNRKGIEEAVTLGLAESRRENKPLSIVMLDLDHFKQINDLCGHAVGDRILTQVSGLVLQNIRTSDVFARWGGEEFVLVCRNTSLKDASRAAQKLCDLIGRHDFGDTSGLPVTASFGVAMLHWNESLDQLFERVDRVLYAAKDRGRNCVVTSKMSA